MATLKSKDIQKMSKKEREGKLKELKLELVKSKANASKGGSSRIKEIKKIIARILTLNK
jgi:ribosomal protein L29